MGLERGQVWLTDFGQPRGSAPALMRPALVISANEYNHSRARTVTVVPLTSNLALARVPGNVYLAAADCGLPTDSVVNLTQVTTIDRVHLLELMAELSDWLSAQVDTGLRRVLALP